MLRYGTYALLSTAAATRRTTGFLFPRALTAKATASTKTQTPSPTFQTERQPLSQKWPTPRRHGCVLPMVYHAPRTETVLRHDAGRSAGSSLRVRASREQRWVSRWVTSRGRSAHPKSGPTAPSAQAVYDKRRMRQLIFSLCELKCRFSPHS